MRYRILFISLITAIAAYVVYWMVLSGHLKKTIAAWIETEHQAGIDISYDKLTISGFPYRFEVRLVKPVVAMSKGNTPFRWTSPLLVTESLAWRPNHVVVLTEESHLEIDKTPYGRVSLGIKGGKASFVTALRGQLKRADAVADSLSIELASKPKDISTVGHVEAHLRTEYDYSAHKDGALNPNGPPLDNLALSFTDIHLAGLPKNPYGNKIAVLQSEIELRGTTPPARNVKQMGDWRDRGGTFEFSHFILKWGDFDAKASGTMTLDKEMRPLGAFVVKVKGYGPLIDYLDAIHVIDGELAANARAAMNMIVQSGSVGDEGRVAIPIALQGGRFFFGPLPLAKVPSILPYLVPPAVPATPPSGAKAPLPTAIAPHIVAPAPVRP
jgi:hypothetical protein